MDGTTRKAVFVFGVIVAALSALFAFFLMGWIGLIQIATVDPTPLWVYALLTEAFMIFFLAMFLLLATGKVRLPEPTTPPNAKIR